MTFGRALLNDSYRTNVSLLHPPELIAIACLHLSSVLMKHDLQEWLNSLPSDFDKVSMELLRLQVSHPSVSMRALRRL